MPDTTPAPAPAAPTAAATLPYGGATAAAVVPPAPVATIGEILPHAAAAHGDRTALVFEGTRSSFAELDRDAARVAAALAAQGAGPATRIALWVVNSRDWLVAYYGAARTGAVLIPIHAMLTPEEVRFILADAGATMLVTSTAIEGFVDQVRAAIDLSLVVLTGDAAPVAGAVTLADLIAQEHGPPPPIPVGAEDLSTICYTSGTTGRPKGALLSHRAIVQSAWLTALCHARTAQDVVVTALPCTHVYGNAVIHAGLLVGATLVLQRRFDSDDMLRLVAAERATMLEGVPTTYFNLVAHPKAASTDLSSLTRCTVGGQSIPQVTIDAVEALFGCPLIELWGMTELAGPATSHWIGATGPGPQANVHGSIGTIFPTMEVRIEPLDQPGGRAPADGETIGELCVRGPLVMDGYLNRPDATAETIDAEGWLHTGDLAVMTSTGHVSITGRRKEMIITGGFNIYPTEVEGVLARHPAVKMVALGKVPDDARGELAVAYVVRKDGLAVTAGELDLHARAHLAPYKCPRRYRFVVDLPKTGSGKIMKHRLESDCVDVDQAPTAQAGTGTGALFQFIRTEVDGPIGTVVLSGPKGINALNEAFITEIVQALAAFEADRTIRVILLRAETLKTFSVGADIAEMHARGFVQAYDDDFFATGWGRIAQCRKPLIAAVAGLALGGGCELALMADIVIAGESAQFGLPEVRLGIVPGAGGTQRLARQIGKSKAMEIILTGQVNLSAAEALSTGLAARVVADDQLVATAHQIARMIAANSTVAVRMAKEAVNRVYETSLAEGLMFERRLFYSTLATRDKAEGTRAFLERRAAYFEDQ